MASCLKAKARQGAEPKGFVDYKKARDALSFLKWKTHEAQVRDKAQKANRLFSSLLVSLR